MLGDIGLKTHGWGNVLVENNHIDVFIFDFADVLRWLSNEYNEPRFADFATVISSSMRQLLPYEGHQCGIAKKVEKACRYLPSACFFYSERGRTHSKYLKL